MLFSTKELQQDKKSLKISDLREILAKISKKKLSKIGFILRKFLDFEIGLY